MSLLESIDIALVIPILGKGLLGFAIIYVLAQYWNLWADVQEMEGIFPASIPILLLFTIAIVVVLIFHLSPFHLLWMAIASVIVGFFSIMLPPVQGLSMDFLVLLAEIRPAWLDKMQAENDQVENELANQRTTSKQKKRQRKAKTLQSSIKSDKGKSDKGKSDTGKSDKSKSDKGFG